MADVLVETPSRPKIQIVPVRGLPIVAVVLAGLVATIASNKLWPLEFYHVVGGGMWTALDLFLGLVIGPILATMPVAARAEFSARFMPKMLLIMPVLVTMTLASGWQLARYTGDISTGYPDHWWLISSYVRGSKKKWPSCRDGMAISHPIIVATAGCTNSRRYFVV